MRRIQKWIWMSALFFLTVMFPGNTAEATEVADGIQNEDITVVADLNLLFEKDGSYSMNEFTVQNHSLVPITITGVQVTTYQDWELVSETSNILVDTKKLAFALNGRQLYVGENAVSLTVPEQEDEVWDVKIKRGAWTQDMSLEQAFHFRFIWEYGTKEFELHLDGNGSSNATSTLTVQNGETVTLPTPSRVGYEFAGWKDDNGNLFQGEYTMPIGDTTLTAYWKEIIAYAIYSADDKSLRFVQSADVIKAGDTYGARKVTSVYTGFDKKEYAKEGDVPWYADGTNLKVTKVYVEDEIKPISMQLWFYEFENCSYFDVTKVNTSNVTSLSESFRYAGYDVTGSFKIVGLNNWNVSKVTDFSYMFDAAAIYATSFNIGNLGSWNVSKATTLTRMFSSSGMRASTYRIGDLSGWNTANVVYMGVMFKNAGEKASWSLNCSKWNVKKVKVHDMFNEGVEDKVTAPKWVS